MQTEQKLTEFNSRVQRLRARTGQSQAAIATLLDVSRTTLHYYCTGQTEPKASALFRLEQAERLAGNDLAPVPAALSLSDHPLPEESVPVAGERFRPEAELIEHLRWLQGARLRQQEVALAAQQHLHQIEGWIHETEEELRRVRATAERQPALPPATPLGSRSVSTDPARKSPRPPAPRKLKRAQLRDIHTVSLPIYGALPAGWPQTRDGVLEQRPAYRVRVRRGRFPEGAFGLEVRGDSMNAACPAPILDRDIVVLVSREQREPQPGDIVAALIDGETCLKRLKTRKKSVYLQSESTNPAHGEIHPTLDLMIQGVLIGKI